MEGRLATRGFILQSAWYESEDQGKIMAGAAGSLPAGK